MDINLSKYNCIVFGLCLFLSAYNLVFYSTYKDDQCMQSTAITRILSEPFLHQKTHDTINFNQTISRQLDNSSNSSTISQQFQTIISSVQLSSIPFGLGILYLILALLSVLAAYAIDYFSRMLPEKFASLGFFMGMIGCFLKTNPTISRLINYIIFLMILIQFGLIFSNNGCKMAKHSDGVVGEMWDQSIIYNIVTLCFWVTMFFCFPFIRTNLPQEAFVFEPYDSDIGICRYIFCTFLGPN